MEFVPTRVLGAHEVRGGGGGRHEETLAKFAGGRGFETKMAFVSGKPRTVVLVEGASDKLAVEALAERRGRDLIAERISVQAMGGATNVSTFVQRFASEAATVTKVRC